MIFCGACIDIDSRTLVNLCIVEPGGVKTEFERGSKRFTKIHEDYDGTDMPARKLAAWVKKGIASGAGGAPASAIADVLYIVATRGDNVPLWLPLTSTAYQLIKMKSQTRLDNLEAVKELTFIEKR
jgi:hypothetical protein